MTLLETRELGKRFGGVIAVDGLSLRLEAGEVRGLIGPNGSGKSTVINLVTGVLRPSEGSVHFRGEEITAQATETLFHRGIARTFQTPRVVPGLTVLENVLVAAARLRPLELMHALMGGRGQRRVDEARRQAAGRLLEMVGLEAHADTPAQTLPHAQRRLLEIVRALAGTPAVLFLDEPAAGMSGTETAGVMALIRALATRGVAIVLVEHNMRVVMGVADRVTVLDFGRVIAEGTPAEIRRDRAVRTAYLGGVDDEPGTGSDA